MHHAYSLLLTSLPSFHHPSSVLFILGWVIGAGLLVLLGPAASLDGEAVQGPEGLK